MNQRTRLEGAELPAVMTAKQVANYLQTTENTLAQDRYLRRGLPFVRVGRKIRYLTSDVAKYMQENRIGGDAA